MIRFIKKIFPLLFILALAALGWYYQDWVKEQYRHAQGVYYIYKGDVAYSSDNMAKTLEFYHKGLELYPGHYEAWFNLGNIYAVSRKKQFAPYSLIGADLSHDWNLVRLIRRKIPQSLL